MAISREKLVKTAEKYVTRGKIDAAIKEYRKLLEENPQDTNTLNRVGDLYARIQKFDEAVKLFTQIAEQYTGEGFFVKAIAIFKKIIKLDPTRLEVYEQLAELYHKQGLINEAKTQYQVLADYYVKHDNAASAISIYQSMVALEPEDPAHHAKLAELYQKEQLVDKAMGEFSLIADLMLSHGQVDQAVQVLQRAFSVHPEDLDFVKAAVAKFQEAGETGAAARLLAAAAERNPEARRLADTDIRVAMPEGEFSAEAPEADLGESTEEEVSFDFDAESESESDELPESAVVLEEETLDGGLPWGGDDLEAALSAAGASVDDEEVADLSELEFDSEDGEAGDFVLEWDEDVSESIVMPPSDMDEGPGEGFQRPTGEEREATGQFPPSVHAPSAEIPLDDLDLSGDLASDGEMASEFELELELEEEDFRESLSREDDLLAGLEEFETAVEVPEPEPEPEASEDDVLSEAEVLAKYGLRDKALERIEEILKENPQSVGAYRLSIQLRLESGEQEEEVLRLAGEMAILAREQGQEDLWLETRQRLEAEGYQIDVPEAEDQPAVVEAPKERPKKKKKEDRINRLLESLLDEAPKPRKKPRRRSEDLDALLQTAAGTGKRSRRQEIDLSSLDPATAAQPAPTLEEPLPAKPEAVVPDDELEAVVELEKEPVEADSVELDLGEIQAEQDSLSSVDFGEVEALESAVEEATAAEPAPPARPPDVPAERVLAETVVGEDGEPMTIEQFLAQEETPIGQEVALGSGGPDPDIEEALSFIRPAEEGEEAEALPAVVEETGTSWLDQVSEQRGTGEDATVSADDLFDEEEDFFDLASELEEELEAPDATSVQAPKEPSLDEIVEGFKQGVAETLSSEDYDTHFNLGIAYREMGLLDEAIGEFQLAAKDPGHLVQCCSMLAICFLDKGLPELAIKWFTRGLASPEISGRDSLALLYDLGEVYLKIGDKENARKTFVEVYGMDTNFRDVAARLQAVGAN